MVSYNTALYWREAVQHRVVLPALYSMYSNAALHAVGTTIQLHRARGLKSSQREKQACGGGTVGEQGVSGDDLRSPRAEKSTVYSRLGSSNSIIELSHQRASLSLEC